MLGIRHFAVTSIAGVIFTLGLVGCEPQHPQEIPPGASLVAAGDKDVAFTAPSHGMIYVYVENGHQLVWSGKVDKGGQVMIDRMHDNRVLVDGNLVVNKLRPFHNDQIYFQGIAESPVSPPTVIQIQPAQQQPVSPPPTQYQSSPNSVTITPSVSVSPNQGQQQPGSLTVSPNLSVSPATQPAQP